MNAASERVIEGIWIAWAAFWLLASLRTKRTVERGGLFGYRTVTVVITLALLGVFALLGHRPGSVLWHTPGWLALACVCLTAIGAAFAIWARVVLGRNWSAEVTFKQEHELIESGPYALARHPIYTGILAMGIGTAVDYARPIGLALLIGLCGGFWWKARDEERIMSRHFPKVYAQYKARVHAIIPFVL